MKTRPKSKDQSSSNLIDRFHKDCYLRELSSTKDYIYRTKEFCAFLEARGKNTLNADRDDLKAFLGRLKERGIRSTTINRIFTSLSAFYEFLIVEELVEYNLILPFRKYYLRRYKNDNDSEIRKLISVEDASKLVNSVLDTRDRCVLVLLFKTGMRVGELTRLDVNDINLDKGTIHLKQTAKRSNRVLYLDDEAISALGRWLASRKNRQGSEDSALFLSKAGSRMKKRSIELITMKHAERIGLHDPLSLPTTER